MRAAPSAILLAGLLLMGALLPGCFLRRAEDPRSTPAGTVEAFLKAFQEKDLETVVSLHLAPDLSPEDRDFLGRLADLVQISGFTVTGIEQSSPDEALVQVEIVMIIFGQESIETSTYRVMRKDGQWLLHGEPVQP